MNKFIVLENPWGYFMNYLVMPFLKSTLTFILKNVCNISYTL